MPIPKKFLEQKILTAQLTNFQGLAKYLLVWPIFFISLSVFSLPISPQVEVKIQKFSKHPLWLRMMHYQEGWLGFKSEADGRAFFLHPDGKWNPYLELKENIKKIDQDILVGLQEFHPQCAFPLRHKFFTTIMGLKYKEVECSDLNWWMGRLQPRSLSLIYSTAYPNNPASMFGHTFLKVNQKKNLKTPLNDFSVDFSAQTDTDGGFMFAVKGLFGGYRGQFDIKPYYIKVNEYINGESRDLWEYELNFNEDEIENILFHLWELGQNTFFDYYFFDENCSYQLLRLLEIGKPKINLSAGKFFYLLPPDSVKVMAKNKLISKTSVRPSFKKKFMALKASLTTEEKKHFKEQIKNLKIQKSHSKETLEVSMAYLRYKQFERNIEYAEKNFLKKLPKKRAKLKGPSRLNRNSVIEEELKQDPINSHGSSRLKLSQHFQDKWSNRSSLEIRLGLHSLEDPGPGYPNFSNLEYARITGGYEELTKKWRLEEIALFDIVSLFPIIENDLDKSWSIQVGSQRAFDLLRNHRHIQYFETHFGLSFPLLKNSLYFYGMGAVSVELGNTLAKSFRYGPGASFGLFYLLKEQLRILCEYKGLYDLNNNTDKNWRFQIVNQVNFGLTSLWAFNLTHRLVNSTLSSHKENAFETGLSFYF